MPEWYERQQQQARQLARERIKLSVLDQLPETSDVDIYIAAAVAAGRTVVSYAHRDNGKPTTFRPSYPL